MRITSVRIANFKAIADAQIDLHPTINVLVGANGSGKSSVLQALHWMFQSGRNGNVEPRAGGLTSTLSEKDAIYMPSPDYRSAGHGSEYGNNKGKPQLDLKVDAVTEDGTSVTAAMWLKSARNEGISVHVPTGNQIVAAIRDRSREFSAYIPGVAGIPLAEEKRSKLLVHRSAAAGDANTVLRNMLVLLKHENVHGVTGLSVVEDLMTRVMGEFRLRVDFDEDHHTSIAASFQTGTMREREERSFRPLELAGIGYLQVLQIFSYLVYFRPVVLLVDEPDAHLYPVAQERLVRVLAEAASLFDAQVLLTTHSPSIVRSLPADSKVIWMKDGVAQPAGDSQGRNMMGWGLLDRKIVLMTEDSRTDMLRMLLAQWPDLERLIAIWPFHGTGKLPPGETLSGLKALLGNDVRFVIHRDRDFMMPPEVTMLSAPYESRRHLLWVTRYSDVEAYWASESVVAAHFGVDDASARALVDSVVAQEGAGDAALIKMRNKRREALQKLNSHGTLPQFGDAQVLDEFSADGAQFAMLGKSFMSGVRRVAQEQGLPGSSRFGHEIPDRVRGSLAHDLRILLESVLA